MCQSSSSYCPQPPGERPTVQDATRVNPGCPCLGPSQHVSLKDSEIKPCINSQGLQHQHPVPPVSLVSFGKLYFSSNLSFLCKLSKFRDWGSKYSLIIFLILAVLFHSPFLPPSLPSSFFKGGGIFSSLISHVRSLPISFFFNAYLFIYF